MGSHKIHAGILELQLLINYLLIKFLDAFDVFGLHCFGNIHAEIPDLGGYGIFLFLEGSSGFLELLHLSISELEFFHACSHRCAETHLFGFWDMAMVFHLHLGWQCYLQAGAG